MLADIYENLKIGSVDTKLIKNAIYSENTWALSWELAGIVGDFQEPIPPEVEEVCNILDMWTLIEEAYATFDLSEKTKIENEACLQDVVFPGFDANREREYSIARFFVDDMDRFSRFKGRDLNSHAPQIETYRQMYSVFPPIRKTLIQKRLTSEQIIEILNAAINQVGNEAHHP